LDFIDSTIVKVHRCAVAEQGGEKAGDPHQPRRRKTTKKGASAHQG
jgi:hypothetical protein